MLGGGLLLRLESRALVFTEGWFRWAGKEGRYGRRGALRGDTVLCYGAETFTLGWLGSVSGAGGQDGV